MENDYLGDLTDEELKNMDCERGSFIHRLILFFLENRRKQAGFPPFDIKGDDGLWRSNNGR